MPLLNPLAPPKDLAMRTPIILLALLSSAFAGARWLPVDPYSDPAQLEVPWPKHSHVKQPWRGFLETTPAAELLDGIGVCFHHHGGSIEAQLGLLVHAGVRCLRWEQPLGTYDPETKSIARGPQRRYREILRACTRHGIRPIILMNAHHGVPCKMKSWQRRVLADTPKGSRTLRLDSVAGLRPVHSGLANLTGYWAGEVLFTAIDEKTNTVTLSKPLPKALEKGQKVHCVDLYYLPLHPVGTPEFEHTAGGWVDYARSLCAIAQEEGVEIELEVWNELSFGSYFAGGKGINAYWPGHATFKKDFLRPGGHAWEMTRRVIEMAETEFPDVRIIWGWSNTTFFHTPIEKLPAGTDGQSYHPYGTGWRKLPEREQAPHQPRRCLEGHCPTYRVAFAEGWAHTFIQCESLMHLLRPDKRRTRTPPGVERFDHYITEHGIVPAEVNVKGEAAALRLKEKFALRAVLFWLGKGIRRLCLFQAVEKTNTGMGIGLAKTTTLDSLPPEAERHEWLSPALRAIRRAVLVLREGVEPVPEPRQFTITDAAKFGTERKVFEMPEGKPTLTYRDLFVVLPMQVNARTFVFAVYVMSPSYPHEDLAETPYRLTIAPLAADATLRYYDPLADREVRLDEVQRGQGTLTLRLPVTDTPRLLIVKEGK
jgi:hypothetical protein